MSKEFAEQVDFQTSVRGIKVRGSYETMREAQIRSEVLKRKLRHSQITQYIVKIFLDKVEYHLLDLDGGYIV